MDRTAAIKLALAILEPFKEAGNIYADYQADEKFTDEQYDEMLAELKAEGPFSILYEADGTVYKVGPYNTEAEALAWAKEHNGTGVESEFDINDQHVYILHPDHRLEELSIADVERICPLCNEVIEAGDKTDEGEYGTVHHNCPDFQDDEEGEDE